MSAPARRGTATRFALDVVERACRAPSIHNTQPWAWRVDGTAIELHADRGRHLAHADPDGRNLLVSCGTALHHAQVAARGLGWEPHVDRFPVPREPDLLARISLEPAHRSAEAVADLRALNDRCTDRRRFTSWPVGAERLDHLVQVATAWGGSAVALTDVVLRFRLESLVARARLARATDAGLAHEVARWLDGGTEDGLADGERDIEGSDGLLVLVGPVDDEPAWLVTGEALGGVWLDAVRTGLSVVPLSQVVEVPETRASLHHEVLDGRVAPHLLLRIGWQQISRHQLRRTARRPVQDVLLG